MTQNYRAFIDGSQLPHEIKVILLFRAIMVSVIFYLVVEELFSKLKKEENYLNRVKMGMRLIVLTLKMLFYTN